VVFEFWLTVNADKMKLYFLLNDPKKQFSGDDERFLEFFRNRYVSLDVQLRKKLPLVWNETMEWLRDEVFLQQDDGEVAKMDQGQQAFEDGLFAEIAQVSERHYAEARRLLRGTPEGNGEGSRG
jgi:hypothetical protein